MRHIHQHLRQDIVQNLFDFEFARALQIGARTTRLLEDVAVLVAELADRL